mgnify:CR=1 FL=1
MDLGIQGRKALVCASSQGLGHACALALAQEGCLVVINGRNAEKLALAAQSIRAATGQAVMTVAAALPIGANVFLFSQRYRKEEEAVRPSRDLIPRAPRGGASRRRGAAHVAS